MNDLSPRPQRQPVFNLPGVVLAVIAVLVAIHAAREYLLGPTTDAEVILTFAFIPARLSQSGAIGQAWPGGAGADLWTFVTYALLHADWTHVGFNSLWLAAFGSPLAWRFGPVRFLLFSVAGAVGGAAVFLLFHVGEATPVVGASAAISAHMAGAARFVFAAGGPLGGLRGAGPLAYRRPAAPLAEVFRDSRVLMFLGVWFGLNFLFGLFGAETGLASGAIAWEAHVGGFLVGLLAFPLFDPIGPAGGDRS